MDELEWVRECDEEEWDELDELAREWTSAGSADEEVEVEVRELLLLACWLGCEGKQGSATCSHNPSPSHRSLTTKLEKEAHLVRHAVRSPPALLRRLVSSTTEVELFLTLPPEQPFKASFVKRRC